MTESRNHHTTHRTLLPSSPTTRTTLVHHFDALCKTTGT